MRTRSETSLARAVVARYLKLALRAPDSSSHRSLSCQEAFDSVRRAAAVLGLREYAVASTPPVEDLVSSYVRLFGHSLRGRVCPYEIEYGKREPISQAQELSDLCGFYRAFGLEPSAEATERWDHAAFELEFVELLSLKEAYALENDDEEMFEVTRHALRRFLREHLGFFGMALGAALEAEDPDGFYGGAGRLLESYLTAACAELDIPAGPRALPLSAIEEDSVPMACGSGVGGTEIVPFEV